MEELLKKLLSASVATAVFLFGLPLLFAALRWIALKQRLFVCADRRPAVRVGLVLLVCCCLTAIPKPDRSGRVPASSSVRVTRSTDANVLNATNLAFTTISVRPGSIGLGLAWNADLFIPGGMLGLYASTNLVDGWFHMGDVAVEGNATHASVTLDRTDLFSATAAFFRAGTYRDSDGDGLADAYERIVSHTDPLRADTDGDGLSDYDEIHGATPSDPLAADTDGDGVSDGDEAAAGMDPRSPDTDGDGLDDLAEMTRHGTDPTRRDTDGDGLDDGDEIRRGTDPKSPDTDFDDLPDGEEVAQGTDPLVRDTDGDGLLDAEELTLGTDPCLIDTDGDGASDFDEFDRRSDPLVADANDVGGTDTDENGGGTTDPGVDNHVPVPPTDSDEDGMPDSWELMYGLEPDIPDADLDKDNDGLSNFAEYLAGTRPDVPDTDGDQLADGYEHPAARVSTGHIQFSAEQLLIGGRNHVVYTNAEQMTSRYIFTTDVFQSGMSYRSMTIDPNGLLHLHADANGDPIRHNPIPWDLGRFCIDDEVFTIAPCWADLSFTTQSVVRVCEFPAAGCVVVDYVGMRLTGRNTGDEREVTLQVAILFNSAFLPYQSGVLVMYGNVGSAVAEVASVGYRMPHGRAWLSNVSQNAVKVESNRAIYFTPTTGTDPTRRDTDADGREDKDEFDDGTDPLDPDTDGDGMLDGWEFLHKDSGFNPLVDNGNDPVVGLRPEADPDGDGLSNVEESCLGTDPFGWTAYEGAPVPAGTSFAASPRSGSTPVSPVKVRYTFGDPSGSHSEKYRLTVESASGLVYEWVNARFGVCETKTALLSPGVIYTNRIEHYATDRSLWDFDYRLVCEPSAGYGVVVDDSEKLFGDHDNRGTDMTFADAGKIARVAVVRFGMYADYDRKNGIDATDERVRAGGGTRGTLHHWVNDNRSTGHGWDAVRDMLSWGMGDARRDDQVNGACDTLDFTPVWLDLAPALEILDAMEVPYEFRLSQADGAVNVVWTSQPRAEAGAFLTRNIAYCGPELDQDVVGATTQRVTSKGIPIPDGVLDDIRGHADHGVILLEGRNPTESPLVLSCVRTDTGGTLVTNCLPLRISTVSDMYRWVDIHGAADDLGFDPAVPGGPSGLPDAACNSDMFVFVHGYNMAYAESVAWADEFFKRLRQTGSSAMFTAVAWKGNTSQIWVPNVEYVTPNYYRNVRNAFMSSRALARAVGRLPGSRKFVTAHSLGNMLVSASIADWQMSYDRYFMLNAAVAQEAYDPAAVTPVSRACMTPSAWAGYPDRVRASHWNELFDAGDPRRGLTWRGRFGNIPNAVNFYSTEEEVLKDGDGNWHLPLRDFAWYNQETRKGTWSTCVMSEAGWGFNRAHDVERVHTMEIHGAQQDFTSLDRRTPDETVGLTREQLRTEPFFNHFSDRGIYTNALLAADYERRADLLACAIPAESFAAGANPVPGWGTVRNFDQAAIGKDLRNSNFVPRDSKIAKARHTFFIVSPYYYNHGLYESLLNQGE